MKGGFQTKVGIYRKCPHYGRNFPTFSWSGPHNRTHCKPCMRNLGMVIDGEDE